MKLFLLGEPGSSGGNTVGVTGRRPRAVLEVLTVEANKSVSVERLIDELWPEAPPKTARNSVQRFIADLRSSLGEHRSRLHTTPDGYRLQVEPGERDVDRIDQLHEHVRRATPADRGAMLEELLAAFAPAESGDALTPSGRAVRHRYRELELSINDEWIAAEIDRDGGSQIIDHIDAHARANPFRERAWMHLMTALDRQGRRVEALRAYQTFRTGLAEEVGLSPSAEIRALETQLLSDDEPTAPAAAPSTAGPAPSARVAASNGAPHRTRAETPVHDLVGRDAELDRVMSMLPEQRLITITGPGGVGKTSFASVLRSMAPADQPPVVVRLAETRTTDRLAAALTAAFDVHPESNTAEAMVDEVVESVAKRRLFIVLDNAEHLLDAIPAFVARLLAETGSTVVVTSRESLGLPDEMVVELAHLDLPDPARPGASQSEQLFVRAAAARGVELEPGSARVASICTALGGLPLAIELAAAQLDHLGVADLFDRLDSLLDMSGSAGEARHASLEHMIRWSWDLLDEAERRLLSVLAVFHGRLHTGVIERLAPEGAQIVRRLVAKHLVVAERDGGRRFYSVLVDVRLFARREAERNGELDGLRDAHADYVLAHARQWPLAESNTWLDVIDEMALHAPEYVPVLEWLDDRHRHDDLIDLATRVTGLWGRRGPGPDLAHWARRVREVAQPRFDEGAIDHETRAAITVMALEARFRLGDFGRMARYGEQLVQLENEQPTDLGTTLVAFYGTAIYTFSLDPEYRALVETAAERARDTATTDLNIAQTFMWKGSCQLMSREFDAATKTFTSVLRRTQRPSGTVLWSELGRVVALYLNGRQRESRAALSAMTSTTQHNSIWHDAVDVVEAVVSAADGNVADALRQLSDTARRHIGEHRLMSREDFQIGFGLVAHAAGDHALAADLLADAMPQSPIMATLLLNHQFPDPVDDVEWQQLWASEQQRRLDSAMIRYSGMVPDLEAELERWTTTVVETVPPKPDLIASPNPDRDPTPAEAEQGTIDAAVP